MVTQLGGAQAAAAEDVEVLVLHELEPQYTNW
jgi:hypothetical protein